MKIIWRAHKEESIFLYVSTFSNVADSQTLPSMGKMCLVCLENSGLELTILIVFLNARVNICSGKMLLKDDMMADDTNWMLDIKTLL